MDDFKTVKRLATEMAGQKNYHTQYPLFVIEVDYKRAPWGGEDIDGYLDDEATEPTPYVLDKKFDLTAGVFFTERSIREHIKMNDYHYDNPRPFCISAWRNPDMQAVMRQIIKVDGAEVPSHYA